MMLKDKPIEYIKQNHKYLINRKGRTKDRKQGNKWKINIMMDLNSTTPAIKCK